MSGLGNLITGVGNVATGALSQVSSLTQNLTSTVSSVLPPPVREITNWANNTVNNVNLQNFQAPGQSNVMSSLPGGQALQSIASATGLPGLSNLPGVSSLPGISNLPGVQNLSGLSSLTNAVKLPALPSLPSLPGVAGSLKQIGLNLPDAAGGLKLPGLPGGVKLPLPDGPGKGPLNGLSNLLDKLPQMPSLIELPGLPIDPKVLKDFGDLVGVPKLPDIGELIKDIDLPNLPKPELPSVPSLPFNPPSFGDLPELPKLPGLPGIDDLPKIPLPDTSGLPDLPDLLNLPDIPGLPFLNTGRQAPVDPFEGPDAVTLAQMAEDVYGNANPPAGWRAASAEDLASLGLRPQDLDNKSANFYARVYTTGEGDNQQFVVAFRGSTMDRRDWTTNGMQAAGLSTPHYNAALAIGRQIAESGATNVTMTGHSLGGGLASAAALASGSNAQTFNAAGLSDATINQANNIRNQAGAGGPGDIRANYVRGEILSLIQDGGDKVLGPLLGTALAGPLGGIVGLGADAPEAYGTRIELDPVRPQGTPWWQGHPISRHGMDWVLASLQQQ